MLLTLRLGEGPGKTLGVSQVNPGDRNSPEESWLYVGISQMCSDVYFPQLKTHFNFFFDSVLFIRLGFRLD